MRNRFPRTIAIALLAFPIAALADISGTQTIPASDTFSLDTGALHAIPGDIWWNLTSSTIRAMDAQGSAKLINLGNLGSSGYAALTSASLAQLVYTGTAINGNNDSTNVLVVGDVFVVLTNGGNYSKVLVTGYQTNSGNPAAQDIQIQYFTYGQVFPHMVMGPLGSDVWTTAFILNNTTAGAVPFTITFFQDSGASLQLGAAGIYDETHQASVVTSQVGQFVGGTIQPKNNLTIVLSSATNFFQGWATINAPGVSAQAVFHRHTSGGAEYEATVPASTGGTEYTVPYDATSYFNGSNNVSSQPYITGMAVANLDPVNPATITCNILDPNGASMGMAAPIMLPAMGHTAVQLNSASGFANVPGNIGSLDCTSTGTSFAVLGLRFLGGNDLTSFAAVHVH